MNYAALRSRYVDDTVATASPAKLLTMLYDRLVLDLQRAESAQRAADRAAAGTHLTHAQDIVTELASTLDVQAWDGAKQLMSVYTFLLTELIGANVSGDAERTAACRELVEPLRDAWQQAAQELAVTSTPLEPAGLATTTRAPGDLGVG
ncbi:flagellar export chaperone FliS [Cellulomonas bogoriensis]|uniref:Flagellar biosynthesis protein FliS n=1 Tax=Cellulomonas bogoriensis 69B4 = DSM 16987 TaxID=1386082 RepID=A0A0A0BQP9_9CELL|nr:flagellar export chaperone FliS [Cellulomonas bogoriensis]KGM10240.1 flagellar biosynthesis protein FliS [Cellulomonas bogoriensis 69B4 = DSM 16987]